MKHPTLTLLGEPVATSDPHFNDTAHCESPLGLVVFSRNAYSEWSFFWHVNSRASDDFDTFTSDRHPSLEKAVENAERLLDGVLRRVAALPEEKHQAMLGKPHPVPPWLPNTHQMLRDIAGHITPRAAELAQRLVAAGPKAAHVSASETHEISSAIIDAREVLGTRWDGEQD